MPENVLQKYILSADNVVGEVKIKRTTTELVPIYELRLPELKPGTLALLDKIKDMLIAQIPVKSTELLDISAIESLKQRFFSKGMDLIKKELPSVGEDVQKYLAGLLVHEMLGLGRLEMLIVDGQLEEIVINSAQDPVWVYHKKFGWMKTNIYIKPESEILNYAANIGRRVGRQITILNPLMDAHLPTGDRINATLFPISTRGNTLTIRKFRRSPWAITEFIENKTISTEVAALLWLAIQYEMNMIVSGGTASGKTSFLNVLMPFIQPNHRVISIEDSVTGDSEIVYERSGKLMRSQIKDLIDPLIEKNGFTLPDGCEVAQNDEMKIFSMTKIGKIELVKPSSFIRHKVNKKVLEITFRTGKKISVTEDHSLFKLDGNCKISPISGKDIKIGDFLATPRYIPYNGRKLSFDISNSLHHFDGCYLSGIRNIIDENYTRLKNIQPNRSTLSRWRRRGFLPVEVVSKLGLKRVEGFVRSKYGSMIPTNVEMDNDLLTAVGLWIADGSYDTNSIIFSVSDKESRRIVKRIARRFRCNWKMHSDGISIMINSKPLKIFFEKILGLIGDAYTKKMPDWVFGLDEEGLSFILKGYISGDGWVRRNDVSVSSCSLQLIKDVQTLLLRFGILFRYSNKKGKDNTYQGFISGAKFIRKFFDKIGFLQDYQNKKMLRILQQTNKDASDVIPLPKHCYIPIKQSFYHEIGETGTYDGWRTWHGQYTVRGSDIGRGLLARWAPQVHSLQQEMVELSTNDIFWDQVADIKSHNFEGYVYDISVPGNESFICNNVVAHNTRELTLPDFLHWIPLTTREPNPEGKGEVCMYPGSYFIDSKGEIHEISAFVESLIKNNVSKKIKENVEVVDGKDFGIIAGDPINLTYKKEKVKCFSKITDRKFICEIICDDGSKIRVTENTKLPVLRDDGKMVLLTPREIKPKKSYIPMFNKIDLKGNYQRINIFEVFDDGNYYACGIKDLYSKLERELRKKYTLNELAAFCGVKRQSFYWYRKTGVVNISVLKHLLKLSDRYDIGGVEGKIKLVKSKGGAIVKVPKILDEQLAYLVGFILAEKTIGSNRILISQKEDVGYILNGLVKRLFNTNIIHKKNNSYRIFSSVISHLMKKVFCATYSGSIRVPGIIMRSPDSVIASFLAGYIDGDGTIQEGSISFDTSSEAAVQEFRYLLLRLGIMSRVYDGKRAFTLNICTRDDVIKACSLLPFRKKSNVEKAKSNLQAKFDEGWKRNRIPYALIMNHIITLKEYMSEDEKYKYFYRYAENPSKTISKQRLSELCNLLNSRVHTTPEQIRSLKALSNLATRNNIEFVKVKDVKIIENKENIPSYDITPEESEYFVATGGGNFTLVQDTMLDLLVNSLRMRPDRIIVGEIRRSREAEVLFEAMHTGHSVYATLHADTAEQTYRRMISPPINIPEAMLEALHLITVCFRDRRLGIRRVYQVAELIPTAEAGKAGVNVNVLYRWKPVKDEIIQQSESYRIMEELRMHTGMTDQEILDDLVEKNRILEWATRKKITAVNDIGRLVSEYYNDPEFVLKGVEQDVSPDKIIHRG